MKKSFLSFLLILTLIMTAGLCYADEIDEDLDIEISEGDSLDIHVDSIESNGTIEGDTTNTSTESTSEGSSGSSGTSTTVTAAQQAYNEAYGYRQSASSTLSSWRSQIQSDDTYHLYPSGSLDTSLAFGYTEVPSSDIRSLLSTINSFSDCVNENSQYSSVLNLIYDDDDIYETNSGEIDGVWDDLDSDEQEAIIDGLEEEIGVETDSANLVSRSYYLDGTNGNNTRATITSPLYSAIAFGSTIPLTTSYSDRSVFVSDIGNLTGIRTDLVSGGMNAYTSETDDGTVLNWLNRFVCGFSRYASTAMEDYCDIGYLKEYHLTSVTEGDITITSTNSDTLYYYVYDSDGNLLDIYEAQDTGSGFDFTLAEGYSAGTYTAIPYQDVNYVSLYYVDYEYMEYLIDLETLNILYFQHVTVDSSSNGTSYVVQSSNVQSGLQVSEEADIITFRVNALGEIETDESGTERVE